MIALTALNQHNNEHLLLNCKNIGQTKTRMEVARTPNSMFALAAGSAQIWQFAFLL